VLAQIISGGVLLATELTLTGLRIFVRGQFVTLQIVLARKGFPADITLYLEFGKFRGFFFSKKKF
jgi:hypothetical protein